MCLAIPARVAAVEGNGMAAVDIMGVTRRVSLDLVPEAAEGDYVLVHAGFALQVIDQQFADETMDMLRSLPFFAEEADAIAGDEEPSSDDLLAEEA